MKIWTYIFKFIKSDILRKPFIIYFFSKRTKSNDLIDIVNRFILSNISKSDYIGEISEVDNRFLCLYNSINEKDILNILEVMEMAYYTELIKNNKYEIKMIDKDSLSLFKKGKLKLIKHDENLKLRYIQQVKSL